MLTEPLSHKATLFTMHNGALPIHTTSLYCHGVYTSEHSLDHFDSITCPACHSRYHHYYRVHAQSSSRTYYGGVPDVIQVAKHYFIESAVLELFVNCRVFGWCVQVL